jgi:hypothetical protein
MTEPSEPPNEATITADLDLVVGGSMNPDHIGVDLYNEVLERVRRSSAEYLRAAEARYLGARFDALEQSRLHLPRLLELLYEADPVAVRDSANALLRHYDAALVIYDNVEHKDALAGILPEETLNSLRRLDARRRTVRALVERTA